MMRPPRGRRVLCALRHAVQHASDAVSCRSAARRAPQRSSTLFVALVCAAALLCTTLALSMRMQALPHTRANLISVRAAPADAAGAAGGAAAASPPGYPHPAATAGASLLRRAGAFAAEHALPHRVHRPPPAQSAESAVRAYAPPRPLRLRSAHSARSRRSSCASRRRRRSHQAPTRRTAWRRERGRRAQQPKRATRCNGASLAMPCVLISRDSRDARERSNATMGSTPPTAPPKRTWLRLEADAPRRDAVVDAMRHAWGAYAQHAFGHDELDPLTSTGKGMMSIARCIIAHLRLSAAHATCALHFTCVAQTVSGAWARRSWTRWTRCT